MHYHCEIILPPTDSLEDDLNTILEPFSENCTDEEITSGRAFWDWWQIGGRWTGEHEKAQLDKTKLDEFCAKLTEMKVTCSGLQAGKQELSPASQIPMVDKLWGEYFPHLAGQPCLLFDHSGNTLSHRGHPADVCKLSDMPPGLTCSRVIFAGDRYSGLAATFMLSESNWNGVNHEPTDWDTSVESALMMLEADTRHCKDEYREKITPKPDWLVVTVDYHS